MSSNWIKLNVGGQLFNTTLTTLLSSPDSLLAKMFDPESRFEPPYSKDGVYFLDADSKYFSIILNWLRYKEIMVDSDIYVRNVAKVADYFGLEQLVKEIREIGAVVVISDDDECSESTNVGACLGLYLKQTEKSYRQAGGKWYLYQAYGGEWYISNTLTKEAGMLYNSTKSHIVPRTDWQYVDDEDEWKDTTLKIIEAKEFTFCNVINFSSTKYLKNELLGEFRRFSQDWLNGWPVFKNKEGKSLCVSRLGYWCISYKNDDDLDDDSDDAIGNNKVTSCSAYAQCGKWQYRDAQGSWTDDETFQVKCDVHK